MPFTEVYLVEEVLSGLLSLLDGLLELWLAFWKTRNQRFISFFSLLILIAVTSDTLLCLTMFYFMLSSLEEFLFPVACWIFLSAQEFCQTYMLLGFLS